MWKKISPYITYFLGWPLSLLALFFIGKTFAPQVKNLNIDIASVNVSLLIIGILFFVFYYVLRSYIWYKLLTTLGYKLPIRESLYLWATSQIKRYIPGNVWSFLGVTMLFNKRKVKKSDIAHALVIEAQFVLLSALLLSLLSFSFIFQSLIPLGNLEGFVTRGSIIVVFLGIGLYFLMPIILRYKGFSILTKLKSVFLQIPFEKSLPLFSAMILSLICFGLGYYFTLSSIIFLDPARLPLFVGFFILSLLLGYLSFITPSGLGVREGIITLGLTKFAPLAQAGFAALFGRIVLVIAEIIYLLGMYMLSKMRGKYVSSFYKFVTKYSYELFLTGFFFLYSLYFSIISILRYENYYTGRFDLGNMAQTVWNTYHGRIFELTNPNGTEIVSRLAFHADFILILFAPFYRLWESPNILLILQAIIVGGGGFFVYFLARDVLKNEPLALTLSLLYFFNPSLERATIYDFHAVTLATTFFLGAFYLLYRKKYGWFFFFAILAGITKEQVWAVIALLGIYISYFHKRWLLGIGIFVLSVGMTYFLIWQAIPKASGGAHFALSYYQQTKDGDSPSDLIKDIIFEPLLTIETLTEKSRLEYLNQLLLPLGYLPLAAPLYLIFTGPDLVINLLSTKPQLQQIYYQYTATITPFLFIASIFGIAFIIKKTHLKPYLLILFLSITGISSSYLYGPLPGSRDPNLAMIKRSFPHKENVDALLNSIPVEAKVTASNGLGSHLSHRRYIYTLPRGLDEADYIVITRGDPNNSAGVKINVIIQNLKTNTMYKEIYDDGNVIAFQKKAFALK